MLEWLCRWAVPWLLLLLYGFFLKERGCSRGICRPAGRRRLGPCAGWAGRHMVGLV